jgi:hypothetical protein
MRLLHPKTLRIAAEHEDIPKTVIAHAWSEVFKFKAQNKTHPKMFIYDDFSLGHYLALVYKYGKHKGCKLDINNLYSKDWFRLEIKNGFEQFEVFETVLVLREYFNDNYLFSDACSLYFKGINIFPDIFGEDWRKYVPVESHKEIIRQCEKTINS